MISQSTDARSARDRYARRFLALKTGRSSWDRHWRQLADYISPERAIFWQSQADRGDRKDGHIINNSAGLAANTLASGMLAGITSPARPWFRLTLEDEDLAESAAVKTFLSQVTTVALLYLGKSNIYRSLHEVYGNLGIFGTGPSIIDEDPRELLRAYTVPVGEFSLALSSRGEVDTLYRETTMSVQQVVEQFGYAACSPKVKEHWDQSRYDMKIKVARVIEPRKERDPRKLDARNKPVASCWFELEGDTETGLLEESGYNENPIVAPRWEVLGNNTYGTSPGMHALGDVKSLQRYELDGSLAAEKIVDPPMGGPGVLRNRKISMLPGKFTAYDSPGQKAEPLQVVPPTAVQIIDAKVERLERRIKAALFEDVWLMFSQAEAGQPITAREVAERHEEKMLQLGPVMDRLQTELLKPLVERTIAILARRGKLPPKPQELKGTEVGIEYLSIMAQAQKAVTAGSIRDAAGLVGNLATLRPEVLDVVDLDVMVRRYCDAIGLSPDMLRPTDQVTQMRTQRAKQQQAQAANEAAVAQAQAAKNLGQANTSGDTALGRMLGPVAAAQAGESVQ